MRRLPYGNVGMGDSFRKVGMLIASLDLDGKAAADEFAVADGPTMRVYFAKQDTRSVLQLHHSLAR